MDVRPPKPKVTRTDHNGVSENMPLVTVLCYRGFEVIVAVGDDSNDMIFICARTRRVFDTISVRFTGILLYFWSRPCTYYE